ncbi:MAG: protein-glutamate O-methyltransferase CheR [Lachnospiraceae bacterium]|nr:protein-glutamate O-methyltransferase CheR [Lachnospiraceae bacterium]
MVQGDYEEFKKSVFSLTKIDLNAYKEKQMRRRIDSLVEKHEMKDYRSYMSALRTDREIFDEFINFITINVSEFYRNPEEWKKMDQEYVPELIKKFGQNLKIWSAACSTGDEPYSLVMCLSKHIPMNKIKINATDLDKTVMAKAKVGLYADKSVAGVPKEMKDKYFTKVGPSWQISDQIKSHVTFKEHNLLKDTYEKNYDLIVCRNVLIYFTEEAKADVFKKFSASLKSGALLFIGSTEQIMNYKDIGLKRRSSFFYEKE